MLKIFNSLTKNIAPFTPASSNKVKVYCCGPTVYGYQHIGNLRTYLFEDVLVRTLRLLSYTVEHVMNITDVGHLVSDADAGEDKMLLAARREKKKSHEIADYYTAQFFHDSAKLNIKRPDVVCKATEHIQEMIELIQRIEANGYAYVANGNVYFDVAKFKEYGKMANLDLESSRLELVLMLMNLNAHLLISCCGLRTLSLRIRSYSGIRHGGVDIQVGTLSVAPCR